MMWEELSFAGRALQDTVSQTPTPQNASHVPKALRQVGTAALSALLVTSASTNQTSHKARACLATLLAPLSCWAHHP